jgi:GST-like protein
VGEHGDLLRESTHAHRKKLWLHLEEHVVQGPWFLGERFSALDLYAAAMVRWRPRREWFREHCPKVAAIADALDGHPKLKALWLANFG